MGEVKAYRKKHWTGLDADLASVPNPQIGDSYLATDKNKLYYWEGGAWKTGLGYEYVPRSVTAWDVTQVTLTLDGAWKINGLALQVIVPAGAVAIHGMITMKDDAADKTFYIRQNAVNILNSMQAPTQVANVWIPNMHFIIQCDADRLLDYKGDAGIDFVNIAVEGWFI